MSNQARGSGKQEVQGVPPDSVQLLWDGQDGWQYFRLTSFQRIPESSLDGLAKGSNAGDQGFLPLLALGSTEGEILLASFLEGTLSLFFSCLLSRPTSLPDLLLRCSLLSFSGNFGGSLSLFLPNPAKSSSF